MNESAGDVTVLVTGAAGAIGSATVAWFLERGCTVVGLDRVEAAVDDDGYRHRLVDLADADAVKGAVDDALAGLPPLRHVLAIAGGALPGEPQSAGEPWSVTPDTFRASLDANLVTQHVTVWASAPHLLAADGADRSVVLTSSFNGFTAQGMPAYSAAKAGLVGLMNGLVGPFGQRGVRVNVVAPGTVVTPRTVALWSGVPGHFERLEATSPLGRLAEPADVADSIGALALVMRHVTGQLVVVDGGQSSGYRHA